MGRPPPLRTDGSNAFAHYSMKERVPRIARDVIDRNRDYPPAVKDAIERLARDIETDAPLRTPLPPGPDVGAWATEHSRRVGETWLATEWFYAELAFYRELLRESRFWETGRDPFEPHKEEELASEALWSRLEGALAAGDGDEDRIAALLDACLWGNRVDLSYSVAASRTQREDDDLLVDERQAAMPLLSRPGANIHLVADNTGTELALDLALIDAVLRHEAARVTVHLKMQPTFVSDAMPRDLWRLLDRMRERRDSLRETGARLREAFDAGRLRLAPDPFWTGPLFLWDAPDHLRVSLDAATVVVLKGDANYRRLVGDALWPPSTPFARSCEYVRAPVVSLRTMKSDAVLGLPPGLAEGLDATEPRWRIDGRRGVIQTFVPARPIVAACGP